MQIVHNIETVFNPVLHFI